jgi:hypothetical protein
MINVTVILRLKILIYSSTYLSTSVPGISALAVARKSLPKVRAWIFLVMDMIFAQTAHGSYIIERTVYCI